MALATKIAHPARCAAAPCRRPQILGALTAFTSKHLCVALRSIMPLLRVGVDAGGTNTDAVLLDEGNVVLGWCKEPTSPDVLQGIVGAVTGALQRAGQGSARSAPRLLPNTRQWHPNTARLHLLHAEPGAVGAVMLGTTQFVNACIQLKGLAHVAVVRLCGPATHSLPPFCDMPPRLRQAVGGCYFLASGGLAGGRTCLGARAAAASAAGSGSRQPMRWAFDLRCREITRCGADGVQAATSLMAAARLLPWMSSSCAGSLAESWPTASAARWCLASSLLSRRRRSSVRRSSWQMRRRQRTQRQTR